MITMAITPRIRFSPYHEATMAAGATHFSVYNKMLLPLAYGDLEAETVRLRSAVSMWDVAAQRQVEVVGPEAGACAQYVTARDLTNMSVGQGKYVALCDHDGVLLNDPVLLKLAEDRYWFSLADGDMLLWFKAIVAERGFNVSVSEPDVSPLALQGPKAEDLVADLFGEEIRTLRPFWFVETELDGIPLLLCRSGWSKQGGFELYLTDGSKATNLWEAIAAAGAVHGVGPGAPNNVERIESGLLSWGGDTTPGSNPFEAGMARFVDVDCAPDYIGKVRLQKVAAEGPARLLVGLTVHTDDTSGGWHLAARTPVFNNGRQVGTLSALGYSTRLEQTIGLAQIERAIVESDRAVEVESPAGRCTATIRTLPFD